MDVEVLAGTTTLETIKIQNGLKFIIDYKKVFWNSRLFVENKRIVDLFKPNETIVDLFAGVGPFSLLASKKKMQCFCK